MMASREPATDDGLDDLSRLWATGFSIAELWGYTRPVSHSGAASDGTHVLLWDILSIVEYQVDVGAGHRYLRERLWNRDWIAIGFPEPKTARAELRVMPPVEDAKFGHKLSTIGDGINNYTDVRIVSRNALALLPTVQRPADISPS